MAPSHEATDEEPPPLFEIDGAPVYLVREMLDNRNSGVSCNTLWTGRVTALRSIHGYPEKTYSTLTCSTRSTQTILTDLCHVEEADHHDVGVLGLQEWAVEGEVLSQTRQAPPSPSHNLNTNHTHLHHISTLITGSTMDSQSPTLIVRSR